jgi:glycosyltransferase 2 family protein
MTTKRKQIKVPSYTAQLFLAIVLFIFTTLIVRLHETWPFWEESLFVALYNQPPFLLPFFFVVTQLGSVHMLALLLVIGLTGKRYTIVLRLLLSAMLAYIVSGVAKDLFGRDRPIELLSGIAELDYIVRGPGYPSGHVALVTVMALTIRKFLPKKYRWTMWLVIALVAWSRVYLGVHAPLDIVGGFAIGWGCYALFRHVQIRDISPRRLKKKT